MPTGPGDDILDAIEAGEADNVLMSKYKVNPDQLKAFKSLHYGLSNEKMTYDEIEDYYPELTSYFKLATPVAREGAGVPAPGQAPVAPVKTGPESDVFKLVQDKVRLTKELSATQDISRNAKIYGGSSVLANDENVLNKRKQEIAAINDELVGAGYDPETITKSLGDLPNIPGIDPKQAMQMKNENPQKFDRYKAAIKSQYGLLHAIEKKEGTQAANAYLKQYQALQKTPDYYSQRKGTKDVIEAIHAYVDDTAEQQKLIKEIVRDKSYGYGVGLPGQEEAISNDPRSQNLNPYQVTGLQFLEDVSPAVAQSYNRLLAFSPEELKAQESNASFMRGYEAKARDLENIGMNLMRNSLEEKLNAMLKNKDQWTEEDKQNYVQVYERFKTLSDDFDGQNRRYPAVAVMDADQQMQEIMGSSTKGVAEKTVLGIGENVDDALVWLGELIREPFQSSKETALDDLALLGDKRLSQLAQYETEGQELFGRKFKSVITGDLKEQTDAIKADSTLSDDEQRDAITMAILKDNRKNVQFVPNDKDGKMNFTAKTVLNAVSNVASEIVPQIAIAYLSGGLSNTSRLRSLTSLFGSTFAIAYNDIYNEAIDKDIPNPSQYALVNTTIEAATELIFNDVTRLKKIFGGKMVGRVIGELTEEELRLLPKTGRFAKLKEALKVTAKTATRSAAEESFEEIAGQLASNVMDKKMFSQEVDLTDDVLKTGVTTFVGMLPLAGLGLPFKYRGITQMQKYALYEAAMNPDKYLAQVEEDLSADKITSSEAEARKATITKAAKLAQTMNAIREDDSLLTDNEKTELLTNELVADSVNEQKKNATEETKERLEKVEETLEKEKDKLLKPSKKTKPKSKTKTPVEESTEVIPPAEEGTVEQIVGGEAVPAGVTEQLHTEVPVTQAPVEAPGDAALFYTNPEGREYILRGDKLYYKNSQGEEKLFSEKAMQTKNTRELIETIKQANQQPVTEPVQSPTEPVSTTPGDALDVPLEIAPEAEVIKQSFAAQGKELASKLRSAKRGGKEAFGGFLGLGVAVYDGMIEAVATVIEAGGTIAEAMQKAFEYVRSQTNQHTDDEIRAVVREELIDEHILLTQEQENAIKTLINKAPASINNQTLIDSIVNTTGLPDTIVEGFVNNNRPTTQQPAPISAESIRVSIAKIDRMLEAPQRNEPNWWQRLWEGVKNGSAWTDNPFRFITKITEDINKHYGLENNEQIPLGRQFEKSAVGRAVLKVDSFIDEVVRGNINGQKLGRLKGQKYKDFQRYMVSMRIIDRLDKQEEKQLAGEDVNRQTGNVIRQDAEGALQMLTNKYGNLNDFDARGQAFQRHLDTMLQTLVAAGILSKETYDEIKADNDFYAPFNVVQSKLVASQDKQPVGISGVVKRIKGINFKTVKSNDDVLKIMNVLGEALHEKVITPQEYFNSAIEMLEELLQNGSITQAQYDSHITGLENPGFAIKDILDAAANMIYKAEGIALKNTMLQRLYAYKQSDPEGLFIQDVDGFEVVPKPLNSIKVEPGMAPIKLRVKGKDKIVAVNKRAAEKLTVMSNYETSSVLKAADAANRLFRTIVITVSPGFQIVNFAIDFIRTSMLSRYGLLAGKGLVHPLVNLAFYAPQYMEALLHSALGNVGVKTDTYKQWMESDSYSKGMFDNLFDNEKRIKEVNAPIAKRVLLNFLKLKFISVPGSILEQTHKIAVHQRGMSVEGFKPEMFTALLASNINRNIKSNMTPDELSAAADRLNYEVQNYAGSPNFPQTHKWMKATSIFLQFFSARVKGEMTDYRRLANIIAGKAEGVKLSKQEVVQIGAQFTGSLVAIAFFAVMNNLDDEDEKEFDGVSPFHRDNYLNIPLGFFEFEEESGAVTQLRDYAKVPLRGITATMNVMMNSFVKFYKRKEPEEFKKAARAFLGNASPVNLHGSDMREIGESLASNLTPVFKFFIEYSFNRDTHNHRNIIPDFVQGRGMLSKYRNGELDPWDVATKKTPDWAKEMSKSLFDNLGIRISAIELDHMENTMGNPTELYDNALMKRLFRSESKFPLYTPSYQKAEESATVTPATPQAP